MSGLIVGLVLRHPISDSFNSDAKFIATVYADHAWEDGTHAHPAIETVARITGLSVRTVQRYLRMLENMGMLIPDGKGPRGTNQYRFPLEAGTDDSVRLDVKPNLPSAEPAQEGGDRLSPRQADGGDTESGDTESGDTAMSPKQTTHQNLVVVVNASAGENFRLYEQEIGALTPIIADAIKDAEEIYSPEWVSEAIQIAAESNKRSWRYVEGILKNCKAKNIRPALNKFRRQNGDHITSDSKRSDLQRSTKKDLTDADIQAANRINARKRDEANLPAMQ